MKKLIASLGLGVVAIAPSQAWSGGDMANSMPNGSPNMNTGGHFGGGGHHSFSGGSNYYGGGSHSFGGANGHSGGGGSWHGGANGHSGGGGSWHGGANGHSGGGSWHGNNQHNGGWSNYSGGRGHQGAGHNFNGGNYNFSQHGYQRGGHGGRSGTNVYIGNHGFGIQRGRNYIGFGGGSYHQPGVSVAVQRGRVGVNYQANRYVNYGYSQRYVAPRPAVQYRPVYRPIVHRPVVQYRPIVHRPVVQYRPVVHRPVVQQRPYVPAKQWQRPVVNYVKHYSQRTYEAPNAYWSRVKSGGGCPSSHCYGGNKIQITWYSRPTYRPYYAPRPVAKPQYAAVKGWQRSARVNSHCYKPKPVQRIVKAHKPVCTLTCRS